MKEKLRLGVESINNNINESDMVANNKDIMFKAYVDELYEEEVIRDSEYSELIDSYNKYQELESARLDGKDYDRGYYENLMIYLNEYDALNIGIDYFDTVRRKVDKQKSIIKKIKRF